MQFKANVCNRCLRFIPIKDYLSKEILKRTRIASCWSDFNLLSTIRGIIIFKILLQTYFVSSFKPVLQLNTLGCIKPGMC